jgi:hypothetical protein
MRSNSKLTAEEKVSRKELLDALPSRYEMAMGCGVTVLCIPDGNVTRIYSSVACSDEKKIRRKVGEFHALMRWWEDVNGSFILPGLWGAQEVLEAFDLEERMEF